MFQRLNDTIANLPLAGIEPKRKEVLQHLVDYIIQGKRKDSKVRLNFICTHNSRRSHLCQVWAKTMAVYHGINDIKCYSGGTESTAVYPMVLQILQSSGFIVQQVSEPPNPTYKVHFTEENCPITLFSKRYKDAHNPIENFAAIMTCTDADLNCPIIPNSTRISLPYQDPKRYDDTSHEVQGYSDRSQQIAREMKYVFHQVKHELG